MGTMSKSLSTYLRRISTLIFSHMSSDTIFYVYLSTHLSTHLQNTR